ncbi:type II secretion system protein [bacterium]|nr:type II secretion system protein [bacterium]
MAFTLAETLIVMGIIGVVAALTLPNLNNSTGDKEKVTKVKKAYQNLSDAYGRAKAIYGPFETWTINDTAAQRKKRIADRITEFLKVSKSCTSWSGCMTAVYTNGLGNTDECDLTDPSYILADGMAITIGYNTIYVDIDGPNKGPFTMGKDLFVFYIGNNELEPYGLISMHNNPGEGCWNGEGLGCAVWVLENENLDYLKCASKLSWTNTTCK